MANSDKKATTNPAPKGKTRNTTVGDCNAGTRMHEVMTFTTRGGEHITATTNMVLDRYRNCRTIYEVLPQAYEIIGGDSDHLVVLPENDPANYDVTNALINIMEGHITRFFIDAIVNCLDYGQKSCDCEECTDPMDLLHKLVEDKAETCECGCCDNSSTDDESFDELKVGTIDQPAAAVFNNCHIGNLFINEEKGKNKGGEVDMSSLTENYGEGNEDDDDYFFDRPCDGNCSECDGFSLCGESRPMSDSERADAMYAILANLTPERLTKIEEMMHIFNNRKGEKDAE